MLIYHTALKTSVTMDLPELIQLHVSSICQVVQHFDYFAFGF